MKNKVGFLNSKTNELRVEEVIDPDLIGPVDWGLNCHLNVYKSYEHGFYDESNALCMGMGKLAGSCIPGTHRLTLCFRSPLLGCFFFSTIGGVARAFKNLGLDYLTMEGKCEGLKILALKGVEDGVEAKSEKIDSEDLIEIYKGYEALEGVYALQKFVLDKFLSWYEFEGTYMDMRILTVGPAALHTNFGGIFSSVVRSDGEIDLGSEGWAGRGSPGSVMARAHGVVALVLGGRNDRRKFERKDLSKKEVVDEIFQASSGKSMMKAVSDATVKYRFDKSANSGGTFGVNYFTLGDHTIMFNWTSVYRAKQRRMELYKKLVWDFKKTFDREITERSHSKPSLNFTSFGFRPVIRTHAWKTCGELCPGMCKKVRGIFKKDYEPYEANGPNCGIFDMRAAEMAMSAVDRLGFDAIEFGNVASWIFECIHRVLLEPGKIGLNERPSFDPDAFRSEDSMKNARLLSKLAEAIAYGKSEVAKVLGSGMRRAAKRLEKREGDGKKLRDFAVFLAYGKEGSMVPVMYWAPGNFMPLLIPGKYYTRYHAEFSEPEEFARLCFDRAVKEMYSENYGICRFQRGWVEKILPKLMEEGYGIKLDLDEHNRKIFSRIEEYNLKAGSEPIFWESERAVDIVATMSREYAEKSDVAKRWWEKFTRDKMGTAKEYWTRFLIEYRRCLRETQTG